MTFLNPFTAYKAPFKTSSSNSAVVLTWIVKILLKHYCRSVLIDIKAD
jgi:hypothetical protein